MGKRVARRHQKHIKRAHRNAGVAADISEYLKGVLHGCCASTKTAGVFFAWAAAAYRARALNPAVHQRKRVSIVSGGDARRVMRNYHQRFIALFA